VEGPNARRLGPVLGGAIDIDYCLGLRLGAKLYVSKFELKL
jgi:hypothetical protein